MYHNEIEYLPNEIKEFCCLEKLDLGDNYLTKLNQSITGLNNTLKVLNLRLNMIPLKHQKRCESVIYLIQKYIFQHHVIVIYK